MTHFSLFGVLVRVHVSFWVSMAILGGLSTLGQPHPLCVLYFAVAGLVCLLSHELGHAVMERAMGSKSTWVFMGPLGPMRFRTETLEYDVWSALLIILAGPVAGMLVPLGVFIWIAVVMQSGSEALEMMWQMLLGIAPDGLADHAPGLVIYSAIYLVQISTVWFALNILPIYPLDGGYMLHELVGHTVVAHGISMIISILLVVFSIVFGAWGLALTALLPAGFNYWCIATHLTRSQK